MTDIVHIPDIIRAHLQGDTFEACMQLQGKAFRDVPGRKTMCVEIDGKSYFIKQHFGVGWAEIFKNLITFKLPILGALTEVAAIQKLNKIGIPTTPLVAYGQRGFNPATMRSFVMTEDLGEIVTAEEFSEDCQNKPAEFKQTLIIALAEMAKKLHSAGLVHRDFYLCHFVLKKSELETGQITLYLIDLHRMLQGQPSNSSAVMKDIAGLFFSAKDFEFNEKDWALFKQHYLTQSKRFWRKVDARAQKLYTKFKSDRFQKRLLQEKSALD